MSLELFRESWQALINEISDRLMRECSNGSSTATVNARLQCGFCATGKVWEENDIID
jgi:hypothetical protein